MPANGRWDLIRRLKVNIRVVRTLFCVTWEAEDVTGVFMFAEFGVIFW